MRSTDSTTASARAPLRPHHVPPWPTAFKALIAKQHILMLQGPMGPFFSDLAQVCMAHGQKVTKVHFNGGDQIFWRHPGALRFNGPLESLGDWLRALIQTQHIEAIVLFGQMRSIHCTARQVARALKISVFVFEEGYVRPDYVTIERRGVNALSRQPRAASFYAQSDLPTPPPPQATHQSIWRTALIAMVYSLAVTLLKPWYWRQAYHRRINPLGEALRWIRGAYRYQWHRWHERHEQDRLCSAQWSKRWYLLPLQVRGDSQVLHHSRYQGMEELISEVLASFALYAPRDTQLIIKHHPMDRAYTHYGPFIRREVRRRCLQGRVKYLHDQHLPTLLSHTLGVVTINSTVGLQALHHGAPVITLGESVYSIPGLIYGRNLAEFWCNPGTVDKKLYHQFRHHLIAHTQLNASFYADAPALRYPAMDLSDPHTMALACVKDEDPDTAWNPITQDAAVNTARA